MKTTVTITFIAALVLALFISPARAEVKPGDFITPDNATKVKDLLSPGVYYKVEHGMTMKIVPTERVDWPPPYKDATEKYSGQVALTPDHRSLAGYVAGQPFPLIDPNDPYAGTKIVWNLVYKPFYSDDYDLRFYDCDTEYQANRADDTWSVGSGSRRVRRIDESILSSAATSGTAAFSWDPDHYSGFNAKTEEYDYKLIGERQMLATVHAEHSPEVRCATDGGASACPEAWEMRHMYVIEATPRPGKINPIDSRTVLYEDSEVWFNPYIDTYDRSGRLFRSHIYWVAYRDRPVPDARVAIYPFKRLFVVGAVSTDVQSGQATVAYLPGIETPEKECWYINMGAVDKSFFTTNAMVRAAIR